jgi:hypothetical protein
MVDVETEKTRVSLRMPTRVTEVTAYLFKHPVETLIWRWNWKAAMVGALMRSPIFFTAYFLQKQGLWIAFAAMLVQFIFRTVFGGFFGGIIQAYSRVEPAWHAVLTIPLVVATLSHLIEFFVQTGFDSILGTEGKGKAIFFSIIVSMISAVFNLFAMRRGVLLVKDDSEQSIWRDMWKMPWIVLEFISFPLVWTWRRSKKKQAI